jgi:hypothetical protein
MVIDAVKHWIADPAVHSGLSPTGASSADRKALREAAVVHFSMESGAAEARPMENGRQPQNAIDLV